MKSSRTWWLIFAACTVALVVVLVWITAVVVRLERRERAARADATYQESLRLALWRMDSWLGPRLAREAARPVSGYTPAALGSFVSDTVRLHFEVGADGVVSSPQVPEDAGEQPVQRASDSAGLEIVRRIVGGTNLAGLVARAETDLAELVDASPPAVEGRGDMTQLQTARALQELTKRQLNYQANVLPPASDQESTMPGPLVPLWMRDTLPGEPSELIFVRRVDADGVMLQGFLCDWDGLRESLLFAISDLFPTAALVPGRAAIDSTEMLASIPAVLYGTAPAPAPVAIVSPATTTLAAMWLAVLAALVAVAITLRASIAFGEKRSRFASAVTHELRTPLTTFRMYSEMLAEGMVTTDEQRQTYYKTLRDEADRLGALVENVLAYARLERGAAEIRTRALTLGALIDEVRPALDRQAERGGMTVSLTADEPAHALELDVEAVTQILVNLVENAVKYAADAEDRRIDIAAGVDAGRLAITVRDHGPGIEARHVRAVFAPFERGAREPGDTTPGVGLGLALSRGLARRMGGDLRYASARGGGACFVLSLPPARNSAGNGPARRYTTAP